MNFQDRQLNCKTLQAYPAPQMKLNMGLLMVKVAEHSFAGGQR